MDAVGRRRELTFAQANFCHSEHSEESLSSTHKQHLYAVKEDPSGCRPQARLMPCSDIFAFGKCDIMLTHSDIVLTHSDIFAQGQK